MSGTSIAKSAIGEPMGVRKIITAISVVAADFSEDQKTRGGFDVKVQYRCHRVCNHARLLALVWARGAASKLCCGTHGYDHPIWELSQWPELHYKPLWGHRHISFRCKRR